MASNNHKQALPELALVGDLTDREAELTEQLLEVEPDG